MNQNTPSIDVLSPKRFSLIEEKWRGDEKLERKNFKTLIVFANLCRRHGMNKGVFAPEI
jgi:hypothetical protein